MSGTENKRGREEGDGKWGEGGWGKGRGKSFSARDVTLDGWDISHTHKEAREGQFVLFSCVDIKLICSRFPAAKLLDLISSKALAACPSCGPPPEGVAGEVPGDAVSEGEPLHLLNEVDSSKWCTTEPDKQWAARVGRGCVLQAGGHKLDRAERVMRVVRDSDGHTEAEWVCF